MRSLAIVLGLMLMLVGCVDSQATPTPAADSAVAIMATRTALAFTAVPTLAPTIVYLDDPTDPLTIVLGGEFSRGGYWAWEDIVNLLGVYAEWDAYTTVNVNGQDYAGVPIAFLLDYARVSPYAGGTVIFSQDGTSYSYTTRELLDCSDCVIAQTPEGTLALILPTRTPSIIPNLVRIESR
jgi:hypothetical protein